MRGFVLLVPLLCTSPLALGAGMFDGTWRIAFGGPTHRETTEVVLVDGKGTWMHYASSGTVKNNFCRNKPLPAVVKSATDTEVLIEIDGKSVLPECFTGTLTLHPTEDGAWSGTLPSGKSMRWTRQ